MKLRNRDKTWVGRKPGPHKDKRASKEELILNEELDEELANKEEWDEKSIQNEQH